ncbi:MAG: hypothetical protein Q8P22_06760 [Chloroflexota bacterium]|nr:hypothetical protein [Chloroflexota bacterium]
MQWTVGATISCDALVGLGEVGISPPANRRHECIRSLRLERPRTVEGRHSTVASEFDLKLLLEAATTEQARELAPRCMQEVAAGLSFLASAPADVRGISVTDASDRRLPGREYTTISYADEAKFEVPPTAVGATDAAFLILGKPERVVRALRWIQKSHFTESPLDEFTWLMVAFESVSEILKPGGVQYWRCAACGSEVSKCPACKASTESKMTGAVAMREFVTTTMGWALTDWRHVWEWRGKILHGQADISIEEEHAVRECLPRLEEAVVAAVKRVMELPDDHAPKHIRHRVPFSDAMLEVKWHV